MISLLNIVQLAYVRAAGLPANERVLVLSSLMHALTTCMGGSKQNQMIIPMIVDARLEFVNYFILLLCFCASVRHVSRQVAPSVPQETTVWHLHPHHSHIALRAVNTNIWQLLDPFTLYPATMEGSDPQSSGSVLRNPKHRHIARSAAKRESVQLLGSIKDLQAHFARAGFVEHRAGAGAGLKGSGLNTLGEDDEGEGENRPPPVRDERRRERKTWKEVDLPRVDPIAARREARGIVGSMRGTWDLQASSSTGGSSSMVSSPTTMFYPDHAAKDTRSALVNTARCIRTIRTLALAISHVARPTDRRVSSSSQLSLRTTSRLRPSLSTPSRPAGMPRAVSLGVPERKSSLGIPDEGPQADVQADLRRAATEVLACLRALEEVMRRDVDFTGSEDGSAARRTDSPLESTGTGSTTLDTNTPQTSIRPPSEEDYEDDEEEYNLNALALADAENEQHTQTWEERIVAEGRQYSDLDTLDPSTERLVHLKERLSRWIGVVEGIFQVPKEGANEIEAWAKPDLWDDKPRGEFSYPRA
jgi:hypothetical protein